MELVYTYLHTVYSVYSLFIFLIYRKSKEWLARNQNNVSEWSDMSIHGLLFRWASTIRVQLNVLVYNKADLIIISSFQNSILIGWFPSKSIKGWRKIGWSSIPSKLVKVFDQRFRWPLSLCILYIHVAEITMIKIVMHNKRSQFLLE
jgi:hypothetical protein